MSDYSEEDLNNAIIALAAHMNAAEHRLIELLGEWDARGQAGNEGCTLVQWLGYQCGIDAGTAREKLRVARALRELPLVKDRFARGEVSYSKVRAITRAATPENEGLLLGYAVTATAHQLESIVSSYRHLAKVGDPDLVLKQQATRGLTWHWDDDGMLVINGRFPPEDGALILKALEGAQERLFREGAVAEDEQADSPVAARRADALVHLFNAAANAAVNAVGTASTSTGADRHLVILRVPAEAPAELDHGPVVPYEIARRIACDTAVIAEVEGNGGETLSVGRRTRTVPPWMRRSLDQRDGATCRWPGCHHTMNLHAHHIVHWADGGPTELDNLVLLCPTHHRWVHRHRITAEVDGKAVTFFEHDGVKVPDTPPRFRGNAATLLGLNQPLGIDEHTCRGGWDGQPPDYSTAVEALQLQNPEKFSGLVGFDPPKEPPPRPS